MSEKVKLPSSVILALVVLTGSGVGTGAVVTYQVKEALAIGSRLEGRIASIESDLKQIARDLASKEYLEGRVEKLEERIHEIETARS